MELSPPEWPFSTSLSRSIILHSRSGGSLFLFEKLGQGGGGWGGGEEGRRPRDRST